MIPKVIHYCWFGRGKMPAIADQCIASWKTHLSDYQLRLWNEDSFDVNSVPYVSEAYQERKFAFVTDYVRLYAIHQFGGIYMDTDVEVLKSLDDFLQLPAFSGFESEREIPTGIMASEQFGRWAGEQLQYYKGKHFRRSDGSLDMTTNVEIISGMMAANGFKLNNTYQIYSDCMHIFPKDYFCPKSRSGIVTLTPNSYCIHHFEGSWQPKRVKLKKFFFQRILGPRLTELLVQTKRKLYS
ncbi:glycosyltransferase family 32 protein [Dyadobacter alkalitolerans]|uniref:glycosyltransferase family 32 protein n=1 Tax=Dyadobacter alkalitolerans TaxID=492736 RepID=UPI0004065EEF|nr:glycosyltransferase [Dyadobacter alkalitolerans]